MTLTGWRRIEGEWAYLHAGGAIGPKGPLTGIEVTMGDGRLGDCVLPEPPEVPEAACFGGEGGKGLRDVVVVLELDEHRQRRADQQPKDVFRHLGSDAILLARLARGEQHFALPVVVTGRVAGRPLRLDDFAAGLLALADQLENLPVEFVDPAAQVIERAH